MPPIQRNRKNPNPRRNLSLRLTTSSMAYLARIMGDRDMLGRPSDAFNALLYDLRASGNLVVTADSIAYADPVPHAICLYTYQSSIDPIRTLADQYNTSLTRVVNALIQLHREINPRPVPFFQPRPHAPTMAHFIIPQSLRVYMEGLASAKNKSVDIVMCDALIDWAKRRGYKPD